jgi:hypothetical protein
MNSKHPISSSRRLRQKGNEFVEFALFAVLLTPAFLWMFVNGLNLIRFNQATQICRDIGNLYIHGVDYSNYQAQQVAIRLTQGYGLQAASFTGNTSANTSNSGNGLVILSEVMYVGASSCAPLPIGTTCTNQNGYVFLQRISFGNGALQFNGSAVSSRLGSPTAAVSSSGIVQNYLTDPGAAAPNFAGIMQSQLADGQVAYICETFFAAPDVNFSSFPAGGLYSRSIL